jgi:VWFA-related protein
MRTKKIAVAVVAFTSTVGFSIAGLTAQQRAVFHAEANYIEVDAIVTDRQGHFVNDLTPADFVLHEGDTTQPIDTFYRIDLPLASGAAAATVQPAVFSPDLPVPNGTLNGRIYLLYFDVPSTGMAVIDIRRAARQFISGYMQPGDLAAIWDAESAGQTLTFTSDQAELLQAADLLKGGSAGAGTGGGQGVMGQNGRLRDAAEWLAGIQGRRKSLLLFTSGFPTVPMAFPNQLGTQSLAWLAASADAGNAFRVPGGPNPQEVAGLADVHVYTIDANGLAAYGGTVMTPGSASTSDVRNVAHSLSDNLSAITSRADALRSIADETGGVSIVDTNDFSKGFARIVEDNSHYYVLGYRSPRKLASNRFMSIRVQTNRPGLTVRARKGYYTR